MKQGNTIIMLLSALASVFLAGSCTKDGRTETAPGGPADVMLAISGPQTKTLTEQDYYNIKSVKIYAYAHEEPSTGTEDLVGYAEFNELDWNIASGTESQQTKYFDIHIEKTGTNGLVDFIVLLNDGAATYSDTNKDGTPDIPLTGMDFSTLSGLRFTSITDPGTEDGAVPMSNEIDGTVSDQNNFTFTIKSDLNRQVIPIDVKRCVARLTLNLDKEGTSDITVTEVTLHNGPTEAPLILYSDIINNTTSYYPQTTESESLLNGEGHPLNEETATIAETYLLPNPHGSSDPDTYTPSTDDSLEERTYTLDITYTIGDGSPHTKTVWLPQVKANQQINVTGTIKDEVDCKFTILSGAWDEFDNEINFD